MMKKILNKTRQYITGTEAIVTLEWVGISSVVFIAGLLISIMILRGADTMGVAVTGQMNSAAAAIEGQ